MINTVRRSPHRDFFIAATIFVLCLCVRWPHMSESLWYDEMTTLGEYVLQSWHRVLAAGAGEYVPNDHVLHTVVAKLVYSLGTFGGDPLPPREALLRAPACFAGSLVPVAVAWPLRRREPLLALTVAVLAAINPWLVALSNDARGYTLMLLFGVVATNLLPDGRNRWPIGYAIFLALAVYTVPLAILLIPAHAVAVWIDRRPVFFTWLKGAAIAVVLVAGLYAPMRGGLQSYYRHPYLATMCYRDFLDALPRFALAGERLPRSPDPYVHIPDSPADAVFWALPVLVIVIGSFLGWQRRAARPLLLTLATATALGVLLPRFMPGATEVRFVTWIMLWFCLAMASLLTAARGRAGKMAAVAAFIAVAGWQLVTDVNLLPVQPVREAMRQVDERTPPGRQVVVLYIGARAAVGLYGDNASHHELIPAPDTESFLRAENTAVSHTGHLPWVLIFYERLALQRDGSPPESRGLWSELARNYRPVFPRLPGRLTPAAIYAPVRNP